MRRPQIEAIERSAALAGDLQRGSNVQQWAAGGAGGTGGALFQLDTRGDRNNVVYDGLYKMDVAAYKRMDPTGAAAGARPRQGLAYARFTSHQHHPLPHSDPTLSD